MSIQRLHNKLLIETEKLVKLTGIPTKTEVEGVTPVRSNKGEVLYPFNGLHFNYYDWKYLISVWEDRWNAERYNRG